MACIRSDALHKLTTSLVWAYGCVIIEDLDVRGMARNRRLSRAITDMGFGEFRRQLAYRQALSESEVVVADWWFPSSRLCTRCNALNEALTLNDRMFDCGGCGHREDRDLNAARNLERYPGLQGNLDEKPNRKGSHHQTQGEAKFGKVNDCEPLQDAS